MSETLGSHRVPNTGVLSSLSLRLLISLSHFGLLQPAKTAPALSPVTWFRLPSSGRYYAEPSLECSLHNHTKIHTVRQGATHNGALGLENRRGFYSNESSPQMPHNIVPQAGKPFPYQAIPVNYNVATLDQIIPKAVPAPRENARTLDRSLSNPIYDNRNVYIRGLRPDTNDKTLEEYASHFGRVETSKAIIDTATQTCKG